MKQECKFCRKINLDVLCTHRDNRDIRIRINRSKANCYHKRCLPKFCPLENEKKEN